VKLSVRRGDTVVVIAGKDRGKPRTVERVDREKGRVVVEGVNLVKRHQKPTANLTQSGIIEKPGSIAVSSVMVVCGRCKEPTRIGHTVLADGRRVRKCIRCGEAFNQS
jgi:large subunit ribosomal protein L24